MKNPIVEKVVTVLAGFAVTAALSWGLYLQGRVDGATAQIALHATQLEVDKTRFEYIKTALERIEAKVDTKEKK